MRKATILIAIGLLTLAPALAGACDSPPREFVQKAEVRAWGERCLAFDLGETNEKTYAVTALSVPYAQGREIKPQDPTTRALVNTYAQPVTLAAGAVRRAAVTYRSADVAYLRIDHRVDVKDGVLRRNGQAMLTKSGIDYNNLLWGTAWALSFGLVSLFWWPNTSVTQTYTEAIPLSPSAPAITFEYGGGGGCAAVSGFEGRFRVDPKRMQPGKIYHVRTRVYCAGGAAGIAGYAEAVVDPVTLRYNPEGYPRDPDGSVGAWLEIGGSPVPWQTWVTADGTPLLNDASWPADGSFAVGRGWKPSVCLEYDYGENDRRYCAKQAPVARTSTDTPQDPLSLPLNPHLEGSVSYRWEGDEAQRVTRIDVSPTPRPSERVITDRFEVSGRAVVTLSLAGYTRAQNLTVGRSYEFSGPGDVAVLPGRYSFSHLCGVPLDPAREFVLGDGETLPACFYAGRENP